MAFAALAPLERPAPVPQAVAAALGVREEPDPPGRGPGARRSAGAALLLVLDNCEHVVEACAAPGGAPAGGLPPAAGAGHQPGAPGRRRGGALARPLPAPARAGAARRRRARRVPIGRLADVEAVRLFVERARAVPARASRSTTRNAPAVAEVCRRLDGIPLAIELAAARVRALSVEQIAARLDDRFRLLVGGSRTALPRHRTLAATLDWSYQPAGAGGAGPAAPPGRLRRGLSLEAAEAVGAPAGPGGAAARCSTC